MTSIDARYKHPEVHRDALTHIRSKNDMLMQALSFALPIQYVSVRVAAGLGVMPASGKDTVPALGYMKKPAL